MPSVDGCCPSVRIDLGRVVAAAGLCFFFILAGLDTVTAALGFALEALARDPDLRRHVHADPHALTNFIEEILRVQGPVPAMPRVTTTEVVVGDVTIPVGSACWLMIGAASRDPRRYGSSTPA